MEARWRHRQEADAHLSEVSFHLIDPSLRSDHDEGASGGWANAELRTVSHIFPPPRVKSPDSD